MPKIVKLGVILMVVCIISAGLLAFVYLITQPKIDQNTKLTLKSAEREVLPTLGKGKTVLVSPRGYGGPIEMLVGIDEKGRVSGVKILNQRETPGLGANIVKPEFLKQFVGKSVSDPLIPKKDIDAITGATISSRGVCEGVREALRKAKQ